LAEDPYFTTRIFETVEIYVSRWMVARTERAVMPRHAVFTGPPARAVDAADEDAQVRISSIRV
jgi:hypothetical protein